MGTDELRALIALLRETGVTHYEQADLCIELGPVPGAKAPKDERPPKAMTPEEHIAAIERDLQVVINPGGEA